MAFAWGHGQGCACAGCAANSALETNGDGDGAAHDAALSTYAWPSDAAGASAGLISGRKWLGTEITYAFPETTGGYDTDVAAAGVQYGSGEPLNGFAALNSRQAIAAEFAFAQYASVSGLTFTRLDGDAAGEATLRLAQSATPYSAWGYYPSSHDEGGDVWFGTGAGWYADPERGGYAWHTVLHEIGHALGLKHGHESGSVGALPANQDSMEFSVMTYRAYVGDNIGGGYANEWSGYAQTLMQADIAAIQDLYGANYGHNAGNTTYRWNSETGETFIDGVGQGAPLANRIFMTVWDGGGVDTFDFSNYGTGVSVSLAPGEGAITDDAQRARLNAYEPFAAEPILAARNVFLARLHQDDARALIENAVGGAGDDALAGNQAANWLAGGLGADWLSGLDGADRLLGGAGDDTLYGGAADDRLWGDDGVDQLFGGAGADLLAGRRDDDGLFGGAADDTLRGGAGCDTLDGDDGADRLVGASGDDEIAGGADRDRLIGGAGRDTLDGGAGADRLVGGNDDDRLFGGADRDRLTGGGGDDRLDGGAGDDRLVGGRGADLLDGGAGHDRLIGGAARDVLLGGRGADRLIGGGGGDRLEGGGGQDRLIGNRGDDTLGGGATDDLLRGGAGEDVLDGGGGGDRLIGGGGADRFVFGPGDGADMIADFGRGGDVIDLSAFGGGFGDLTISDARRSAVVSIGDVEIELRGTGADDLGADDFIF